jgi:hypothetical protein
MHYFFSDQASATTLWAARRGITAPLVPGSGAGQCTLLNMAPSALLAHKLGGWTPQNYSKTHMKTESAEKTLSHRAVK